MKSDHVAYQLPITHRHLEQFKESYNDLLTAAKSRGAHG